MYRSLAVFLIFLGLWPALAKAELDVSTAASLFGEQPAVWGMRLSPDGHRVSFLSQHKKDFPTAMIVDLRSGKGNLFLASDPKKNMFLQWCDWANESRLLCSYYGVSKYRHQLVTATRLVAVDTDGSNNVVLAQRQQRGKWAMHQSEIVDWLPDEPRHIYMEIDKGRGEGVSRVDIYKNRLESVEPARDSIWGYWSDGRGDLRIREKTKKTTTDFEYRITGDKRWHRLHRHNPEDLDDRFWPLGFGDDPEELLIFDSHEGRQSLFSVTLGETVDRSLVFSHPEVDLSGIARLGKHRRMIGVGYQTDRPRMQYFDETIDRIDTQVRKKLPSLTLTFVSESWDRRYYLIYAASDVEPGTYYRFDTKTDQLATVTHEYPKLEKVPLAEMKSYSYEAEDGVSIPGYVTLPRSDAQSPRPTIVFPHGGPRARDRWGFQWMPQFFASQGYVVFQANYRGSGGYGDAWSGAGAYREWKRAITDIDQGVQSLIEQGVADPDRICVVGWSYGGYAALQSAAEFPSRYRCAVSIAGVSNPLDLVRDARGHTRAFRKSQIGSKPNGGAPEKRAAEMEVPVLLFHGDLDVNVPIEHSERMEKALRRAKKQVEFVEYEGADHHIQSERQRIDMVQRIGNFLDEHLGKDAAPAGD